MCTQLTFNPYRGKVVVLTFEPYCALLDEISILPFEYELHHFLYTGDQSKLTLVHLVRSSCLDCTYFILCALCCRCGARRIITIDTSSLLLRLVFLSLIWDDWLSFSLSLSPGLDIVWDFIAYQVPSKCVLIQ